MAVGDAVLRLLGARDPRVQAMAGAGAQAAAPAGAPAGAAGAPGTTPPGGQQAAPVAPSRAPESPQDLSQMYMELMDYNRRASSIDRGIGLMGAAFAQPENRDSIVRAMTGGQDDPSAIMSNIMTMRQNELSNAVDMQKYQQTLQARAATEAQLPAIAEQYGVPLGTVMALYQSGKLGEFLQAQTKPTEYDTVTSGTGESVVFDPRTGQATGTVIGNPKPVTDGDTADMKNYRAYVEQETGAGRQPKTFEQFISTGGQNRAGASNLTRTGINLGAPPTDMGWKRDAEGFVIVDENGAGVAVPLTGSKLATEQAEAEGKEADAAAQAADNANYVVSSIKDVRRMVMANPQGTTSWGSYLASLPGTDAKNVSAQLETIKANMGFDKLQAMRAASPTGGALGQVSDFENRLLQATIANLDMSQGTGQFLSNLDRVEQVYNKIINNGYTPEEAEAALKQAQDYATTNNPDAKPEDIDAILEKYK